MRFSRKVRVALGATVASVAIAGAAFAYFTTSGDGQVAGVAGTSTALTITGSSASTLFPGTSSVVSFHVDNGSSGNQFVTTIHLDGVDASNSACLSEWFVMTDVGANQDINPGGEDINATGTITLTNIPTVNQDACKSATLTLNLSSV